MATTKQIGGDPEILAISLVYAALKDLNPEAQRRVIQYVAQKLEIRDTVTESTSDRYSEKADSPDDSHREVLSSSDQDEPRPSDDLDGVSPVASRWMRRNGLTVDDLSTIFSLGVDEIDLVAKKIPGSGKRGRMRSVILLKGVAAYLSSGVARFTHEQIKEACLHYDAFDTANFAKYMKDFSAEVSGSKESGYALTSRGLTEATDLIKQMTAAKS